MLVVFGVLANKKSRAIIVYNNLRICYSVHSTKILREKIPDVDKYQPPC